MSLIDRALPILRALPDPPPFPEGEGAGAQVAEERAAVLSWWHLLCSHMNDLIPEVSSSADALLEWREVAPHLVRSRWPDLPWERLPWRHRDLIHLWYKVRAAALLPYAVPEPADPEYPLPLSLLAGGVRNYLDPSAPYREHVVHMSDGRGYRVELTTQEAPYNKDPWGSSLYLADHPEWSSRALPKRSNVMSRYKAPVSRREAGEWTNLLRAWIMFQVLTGSLARAREPEAGSRALSLSLPICDPHAADLFRELCEHFFRSDDRGGLPSYQPDLRVTLCEQPECARSEFLHEALRSWGQVLSSLKVFPREFRVEFFPHGACLSSYSWQGLLEGAAACAARDSTLYYHGGSPNPSTVMLTRKAEFR